MPSSRRRASRARSASTAVTAATIATATEIEAICQPGMPPTTTVWTTGAGAFGPLIPPAPGTGTIAVDAEASLANATAMTPRLPSTAPSLLKPLMKPMMSSPLLGMRSRTPRPDRCVAYSATVWRQHRIPDRERLPRFVFRVP